MDSNNQPVPDLEMAIKRSMLAKNKLAMIVKQPDGAVNYSCVECSALYVHKEDLEQHLLDHNREYRYLCGICGTGLKRKEHLERHTLEHQEVRPHICPDCGKGFKRKEHMTIHLSIHSGDKTETCPVCHKTFYRKDHLRKHLQTHTKVFLEQNGELVGEQVMVEIKQEILDEYSAPQGADVGEENPAPNNNQIKTEEKVNASDQFIISAPRPFKCPLCKKSYKRKDHLKIHSWTHLRKEKTCSECGKAFHSDQQLLAHMKVHLQSYTTTYEGPGEYIHDETINTDNYGSDNNLLVARSSQKNNESRPHECEICHRRFKRKQHLKVHMNVHAKNDFTIWCSFCGEGFLSNDQFETHQCQLMSQDGDTQGEQSEQPPQLPSPQVFPPQEHKKENKYPAEYMDLGELAAIDSIQYLNVEEKSLPVPQRVFVCKFCSKPFKRKDHYKIHLNIHTGVKSFFCTECGKGFYRKDHLQKHMMVHTRLKPKKEVPALVPIHQVPKKSVVLPEITIHAPPSAKLRMPLQIKVPYQMVVSMDNGEQRAVTIDPQASNSNSS